MFSIQRANTSAIAIRDKADHMLACDHFDPQRVQALVEDVMSRFVENSGKINAKEHNI